MDDGLVEGSGGWSTSLWHSECKDCRAEHDANLRQQERSGGTARRVSDAEQFEYSGRWANRKLDRGETRSDRCERHRRAHAEAIQALAVPYVDLQVIGEVPDPQNPTGPLGGLGALPVVHRERTSDVTGDKFEFGMGDAEIMQLLEGLTKKRIAVVVAGTGTGKSTFMPFRLMTPPAGAPLRLTDNGPIIVTEPRRAAAIGVARYVGEELCLGHDSRSCHRHVGPGYPVGYQVSGDKCWDAACDLIYATDGSVINWIRDGQLARFSTVIVDEAHERSENIDIILTQLREQIWQHEHLRIIITSATLDHAFFLTFFGEENVFHLSVPAQKSFGYGVPLFVRTKIDDAAIGSGMTLPTAPSPLVFEGWASKGPIGPDGEFENLQATTRKLEKLRCIDEVPTAEWKRRMPQAVVDQVVAIAKGTDHGDILAFLPTNAVIEWTVEQIKQRLSGRPFDVYPLLSTTPKATSDKALAARDPSAQRKIVVSSNLAETSLTVKGVRYVVDSGLICEEEWDPRIASGSLPTKPHSQSGLRQRWGRVGRDAPGWVFPLYTAEQFLSLPRNTPPESTRTNLEQFYLKLVAAGADLADAVLPGNLILPDGSLDSDAQHHLEVFASETQRVRHVLKLSGALDAEGDLTSFGRELERYPGDGADALALMLADQLACVHEVALALSVLGQGHLVGSKDDCILQWSREWPAAWRVRAAQCHKGLAVGCADDLDVLVRIVSLWQSTATNERSEWCRRWWINESALKSAWDEVMSTVGALSAAMKSDADRDIEPRLTQRARAVLSHCMVSARYRRHEGDIYRSEIGSSPENALLGFGRLVEPLDRVLAFHRFRLDSAGDDVREPYISHTVAMLDWAEHAGGEPEAIAFELIRRIAVQSQQQASAASAPDMTSLLSAFPIGLVVEMASEGTAPKVGVVGAPFLLPDWQGKFARAETDDRSGFDREWNPYGSEGYLPEEEAALLILKTGDQEENDAPAPAEAPRDLTANRAIDPTIYDRVDLVDYLAGLSRPKARKGKTAPASSPKRGVIVGYEMLGGGRWALAVDPLADHQFSSDPLETFAGKAGEVVECVVSGVVPNHENGAIQFNRMNGLGRLYTDIWQNPGLDASDRSFLSRLTPGSTVTGAIVPDGKSGLSLTIQPTAREHLDLAAPIKRSSGYRVMQLHSAIVVEPPDKWGKLVAELEHADVQSGMTHRFQLRQRQLEQAGIAEVAIGTKILVSLQPDRSDRRRRLNLKSTEAQALAKGKGQYLALDNDVASPTSEPLPVSLIIDLMETGVSVDEAWAFFKESFHLRVDTVLPFRPFDTVSIPVRLVPLFRQRRIDLEQRWQIEIAVRGGDHVLDLVGDNAEAVASAVAAINRVAQAPYVSVRTDETTRSQREIIEARSDIDFVWFDKDTSVVTIIGRSRTAVEAATRELLKPAVGILTLAIGKSGYPVGNGQEIRALCELAGCQGQRLRDEPYWTIRAPSEANLATFFALASERIRGSSGAITNRGILKFVDEQNSTGDRKATKSRAQNGQAGKSEADARSASPRTPPPRSSPRPLSASDVHKTPEPTVHQNRPSDSLPSPSQPRENDAEHGSKGLLKSIFSFLRKGK